jgi:hypothetical protein
MLNKNTPDRIKVWHLPVPLAYTDAYRVAARLRATGAVASDPDPVRDSYGRLTGYDIKYLPEGV